ENSARPHRRCQSRRGSYCRGKSPLVCSRVDLLECSNQQNAQFNKWLHGASPKANEQPTGKKEVESVGEGGLDSWFAAWSLAGGERPVLVNVTVQLQLLRRVRPVTTQRWRG